MLLNILQILNPSFLEFFLDYTDQDRLNNPHCEHTVNAHNREQVVSLLMVQNNAIWKIVQRLQVEQRDENFPQTGVIVTVVDLIVVVLVSEVKGD